MRALSRKSCRACDAEIQTALMRRVGLCTVCYDKYINPEKFDDGGLGGLFEEEHE